MIGLLLWQSGDSSASARDEDAQTKKAVGELQALKQMQNKANADAQKTAGSGKQSADVHYQAGMKFLNASLNDKAIKEFTLAINLKRTFAAAYRQRSQAYYETGEHNKALADLNAALKMSPNDAEALYFRGIEFQALNRTPEAVADFENARKLNPQVGRSESIALSYIDRGGTLASQNKLQDAIQYFKQASTLDPAQSDPYLYLSIIQDELGQKDQAKTNMDKYVEMQKKSADIADNEDDKKALARSFNWDVISAYEKIYSDRAWSTNGYKFQSNKNGFQILRGQSIVFDSKKICQKDEACSLSLERKGAQRISDDGHKVWDFSHCTVAKSAPLKLEASGPLCVVAQCTPEGAHPPSRYLIYSLGAEFKKIASLNDPLERCGSTNFYFIDLMGWVCLGVLGYDNVFDYWNAAYAFSPEGTLILRLKNGHFSFADDLMKQSPPSAEYIEALAKKTSTELSADSAKQLNPHIWSRMIDLIYSGNADAAWRYFDKAWPVQLKLKGSDGPVGKAKFLIDFKAQLKKSIYWDEIKRLNRLDN